MEKKTIILTRKTPITNKVKVTLGNRAGDAGGILNTWRMNTAYRVLSGKLLGARCPRKSFPT